METYLNPDAPLDQRVADLLARLTLQEKVQLLAGKSSFVLHGVERLGAPSLVMTDGPTGVRSVEGKPATVFPVGVAVAATWNPETARKVAAAIGREALALGAQVVLAPTINIMRIPTWGRNFETYSEDPYLAGRIGSAYVKGLQEEGVGASLKHYAANNQELERFRVDAQLYERTLRELYLAAFEMVVRDADPWTVMASYNRLNGTYASEHRQLLTGILKEEWGYEGMVVSDWGAVRSTAGAANAGLDLEMPGPARWFGDKLLAAVEAGEVPQAQVDDNARRVLRLIIRAGLLDGPKPAGELRTPRHRRIAVETAAEAMVLLKNDGLLPLDPRMKRVALVGPNATRCLLQGGGSSKVATGRLKSMREGFAERLGDGVEILCAQGVDNDVFPVGPPPWLFSPTTERAEDGLKAELFASDDLSGEPFKVERESAFVRRFLENVADAVRPRHRSLRWSGWFWPETSGAHEFGLRATGRGSLTLNGKDLITPDTPAREDRFDVIGGLAARRLASVHLEAGQGYPIELNYVPVGRGHEHMTLGVRPPVGPMERASEAARAAEAVVLVVGSGVITEAEGYDRDNLALPGRQDELIEAVIAANPRTVVVLNTGSPVTMPWLDRARAVVQMWLPGEAGPDALPQVLFGDVDPGGRLPVTFPKAFGDHPAHRPPDPPTVCAYSEGLNVGYRHYDESGTEPLFPFGHGLSYAAFELSDLTAPSAARAGEPVDVRLTVRNVSQRAGREVVQLYVAPRAGRDRPPKELKAFAKMELAPGERREVVLSLDARAFAAFDAQAMSWVVEPGDYDLLVGRSAGEIRLRAGIRISP